MTPFRRLLVASLATTFVACRQPAPVSSRVVAHHDAQVAQQEDPERGGDWRTGGWILLGFAGVGAAIAGGTSYLMVHQKSVRDDNCDAQKQCTTVGFNANTKLRHLEAWNVGAFVAAGVTAGVGTLLVVTHPKKRRQEPVRPPASRTDVGLRPADAPPVAARLGVAPLTGGAALTLGASF